MLSFGATMHDFSGWSGLIVLQPKQGNITGTFFSKINLTAKKRFRCYLLTMVKKHEPKEKWSRTLAICPARENSEKRYKGEDVTTSVLNKKKLPGTFAKAIWAKRSSGTLERLNVPEHSCVPDVPFYLYMSLPRK